MPRKALAPARAALRFAQEAAGECEGDQAIRRWGRGARDKRAPSFRGRPTATLDSGQPLKAGALCCLFNFTLQTVCMTRIEYWSVA